jgi:hypothetical protein
MATDGRFASPLPPRSVVAASDPRALSSREMKLMVVKEFVRSMELHPDVWGEAGWALVDELHKAMLRHPEEVAGTFFQP